MTEVEVFVEHLKDNPDEFEFQVGENEGVAGIFVENTKYDTKLHISDTFIQGHDMLEILVPTHGGRNVEQVTRVTGFFSKIQGWNKGKTGELQQRHKTGLEGIEPDHKN